MGLTENFKVAMYCHDSADSQVYVLPTTWGKSRRRGHLNSSRMMAVALRNRIRCGIGVMNSDQRRVIGTNDSVPEPAPYAVQKISQSYVFPPFDVDAISELLFRINGDRP